MLKEVTVDTAAYPGSDDEQHVTGSFFIDDSEAVWLVEKGTLDLFLIQEDSEGFVGPRYHVLRAYAGQAVFGLDIDRNQLNAKLLGVGSPGLRVRKIALK